MSSRGGAAIKIRSLIGVFLLALAPALHAQDTLRAGYYVVESWTGSDRLARRIIEYAHAFDSLPGLPAAAPAFGEPIRIVLAPDDARFRAAIGGAVPEWGAGVAVLEAGLIVLRAYGGNDGAFAELPTVLRHELAHIALYRYLSGSRIPRWFNEGYAVYAAGQLDLEAGWMLRVAFATRRAPPLDSLELAWPSHEVDARIAYLLAGSVVKYLVTESGSRGLEDFLRRWHDTNDFDAALAATYGVSFDQLEVHWRRDVRRRYGWLAVFTQSSVFIVFAALAVLALFLIRRRRDRAKLERLRETEPPDQPEYWVETETETETETGIDRDKREGDI